MYGFFDLFKNQPFYRTCIFVLILTFFWLFDLFIMYNCDFGVLFCLRRFLIICNFFRYFLIHFFATSYFHEIESIVTLTLFYLALCLSLFPWTRRRLQFFCSLSKDCNYSTWIGLSKLVFYIPILKYFYFYAITRYKIILVHYFFPLYIAYRLVIKFSGVKSFLQCRLNQQMLQERTFKTF